jgi:hypothetical protein
MLLLDADGGSSQGGLTTPPPPGRIHGYVNCADLSNETPVILRSH